VKKHLAFLLCAAAVVFAQNQPSASGTAGAVTRTTKALHYRPGANAKIGFQGTELLRQASGEAKVEGKKTNIEIDAHFEGMEAATKFGLEYLTYVAWAVSPQGRADNLGEVVLDHGKAHLKAFTDLQTFGMIVTAEPYSAVSQPGNMVVMENVFPAGLGGGEDITARYELVRSGTYSSTNTRIENAIFGIDSKTPLALFEARNAVRIAHVAEADRYASAILSKAEQQLKQAEDAYRQKQARTSIEAAAREAAQTAEESRVMAVKEKAEQEAQAEAAEAKRAAEERAARDRAEAEAQARARQEADQARAQAEAAKAEAQKAAEEAAQQKAEAEKAKAEAIAQQQALAVQADKARQSAEESQKLRAQAEQAAAESDRLRQQAEAEKQEMRARLLAQLNSVLSTRDTARGLIANMSDVLFKSGSYELLPGARERLAKVSGIVLAYQGLRLQVEGHTDSIGTDEYNRKLSEQRAEAVRDYLVQQGIKADAITASGFGKSEPVATNDTPEGRQQNRRVELVVSGNAIGNTADAGVDTSTSSQLHK
jgi:outer membrane protein OmpA-like peptidoglycan-associated protein